jgi:hypothetical protein
MRVYSDQLELSVDAPPDWTSRGALVLSAPQRPGVLGAATVTVKDEAAELAMPLEEYAEWWRLEISRHADGFELQEYFDAVLAGCRAVCVCFSWNAPFGRAEQTVAFVQRTTGVRTTLTLTAPIDELPDMRETFATILRSLRFGTACYAPPARLSPPPPSGR